MVANGKPIVYLPESKDAIKGNRPNDFDKRYRFVVSKLHLASDSASASILSFGSSMDFDYKLKKEDNKWEITYFNWSIE